jgi:hypothetical protein
MTHFPMRTGVLIVALVFMAYHSHGDGTPVRVDATSGIPWPADLDSSLTKQAASAASPARVDFDKQIKTILQSKCMPCHFSGGQMYGESPL